MKTNLSRLSVISLSAFCSQLLDYYDRNATALIENHPLVESLRVEHDQFWAVMNKRAYSGKGKEVAKANALRIERYMAVRMVLRGMSKATGFSGQADAKELLKLFVLKGKKVFQDSYFSKTMDFNHVLSELATPEQHERVVRLGIAEMIELMGEGFTTFETKMDEQFSANAELRGLPTATKLRKPLEKSLRNYLNFVKAMSSVDERWESAYYFVQEVAPTSRSRKKKSTDVDPEKVE